jgi:hypothetical protein
LHAELGIHAALPARGFGTTSSWAFLGEAFTNCTATVPASNTRGIPWYAKSTATMPSACDAGRSTTVTFGEKCSGRERGRVVDDHRAFGRVS